MVDPVNEIVELLTAQNADWVVTSKQALGELTVIISRAAIVDVCQFMKDEKGYDLLADICGADNGPEEEPRYEINYHLFSTKHYGRLRLKVLVSEDEPKVPSVTGVWKTANWHERETFDMFGVEFEGHPDLRRILLPSDFDGHALREDYPLRGYEPYSMN
jgi:NADH-quinone oxidoreductase subunit C